MQHWTWEETAPVPVWFPFPCNLPLIRSLRKEELSAISGPNEFAEFYNRLKQIKEFHRKHPNEVSGSLLQHRELWAPFPSPLQSTGFSFHFNCLNTLIV